jgi:hypothetical protein
VRLARVEGHGVEPTGPLRVAGWPVAPDGATSLVVDLGGLPESGVRTLHDATPLSPTTRIPWRASAGPARDGEWYVAAVLLSGAVSSLDPPAVELAAGHVRVDWADGATSRVDLPEVVVATT